MNHKVLLSAVTGLLFFVSGLYSQKTTETMQVKFPGEEISGFKKITSDNQSIIGPLVMKIKGKTLWYTGSVFDVSNSGDKIAYTATDGKNSKTGCLFVKSINNDDKPIKRTTDIESSNPVFAPDDSSLCFSAKFTDKGKGNICVINTYEGNAIQHLTDSQTGDASAPVYSSDGKRVYYTWAIPTIEKNTDITITTWRYFIWSVDKSSSVTTQYVEGSSPEYVNGDSLLFTRLNPATYQGEIWMLDIKRGKETMILGTKDKGYSTPKISPDGKKILCVGLTQGKMKPNLDIYIVNIDGTGLKQVTFYPGIDASPCWSPDGKTIYFISCRGTSGNTFNIWSAVLPIQ
jgi:Tol biopolymer transport system component